MMKVVVKLQNHELVLSARASQPARTLATRNL